jgi:RHS repeat-associated protein
MLKKIRLFRRAVNPFGTLRAETGADCIRSLTCELFIHGPGIDQPVSMTEIGDSSSPYYYHYDALGSVVALSDSTGATVQTYEYSVYGQVAVEDANHPNPYMFAGRRFDMEIGLYYNRARYYNPFTGRFLQTDPIGYGGGMNMYAYCRNNSLNYIDPSGLLRNQLPDESLTGYVKTEEGQYWGLVGDWSIEDLCAFYLCDPGDLLLGEYMGLPFYVEKNMNFTTENPGPRTNSGDVVWLDESVIADLSPIASEVIRNTPGPGPGLEPVGLPFADPLRDVAYYVAKRIGFAVGFEVSGNLVMRDPEWCEGKGGGGQQMFFTGDNSTGTYYYTQEGSGLNVGGNYRGVAAVGVENREEWTSGLFYGIDLSLGKVSGSFFISEDMGIIGIAIGGGPGLGLSVEESEYNPIWEP